MHQRIFFKILVGVDLRQLCSFLLPLKFRLVKNLLLLLMLCAGAFTSSLGQGWYQVYPDGNRFGTGRGTKTYTTFDQGQIFVQQIPDSLNRLVVKKLDRLGALEWTLELARSTAGIEPSGIVQLPSDSTYMVAQGRQLYRFDQNGTIITTQTYAQFIPTADVIWHPNGYWAFLGQYLQGGQWRTELIRISATGGSAGTYRYNTLRYRARKITAAADGGTFMVGAGSTRGGNSANEIEVSKVTPFGGLAWHRTIPIWHHSSGLIPLSIMGTADTGCLVAAYDTVYNMYSKPVLVKYDQHGQQLWRSTLPGYYPEGVSIEGLVEETDGSYAVLVQTDFIHSLQRQLEVVRYSANGVIQQVITLVRFPYYPWVNIYDFKQIGNNYRVFGQYQEMSSIDCSHYLFETDTLLTDLYFTLSGRIYDDLNNNCQKDATDQGLAQILVKVLGDSTVHYTTTNQQGDYQLLLADSGQYVIVVDTVLPYRQICPYQDTVVLNAANQMDTVDVGQQYTTLCPHLQVDLSAPFLRRCFSSTYTVRYQNIGTDTASNAYVEVTLDPYLTYQSSSIPLVSQTGQIHRFNLGDLPVMSSGLFTIQVLVDCDSTVLGQTHCSEAHIYPDVSCGDPWLGPNIEVSSTCTNDTLEFVLLNTGAAMSVPQQYAVIEEHVMIRQNPYQLGNGGSLIIRIPATYNYLYRLEVEQGAGFPAALGDPVTVFNHRFCGATPPVLQSPTQLGQYYNGNISPFIALDCQPNIGAFDPNDKQAQPEGYGAPHYIEKNTPIDYRIRFQNTGTDTAFTVVIVDTLDSDLDPSTLQMGSSSHPYTWSLSGSGILTVRYDNIQLPDSNVNEPLSHGFIKFKINQDPNLPDGTELTNRAGIYFDFNAPIITNEVFHTIGSNFRTVRLTGLDQPLVPQVQVHCYPNPWQHRTTLQVEGANYQELRIEVYNAVGQQIQAFQTTGSDRLTLERGRLQSGIYWYRLIGDDRPIATGKMVVQ